MVIMCPLSVQVTSKKYWILNLNNYRNAHYRTLAKAKREYARVMARQVRCLPGWNRVSVRFTLYPGSGRRVDTSNVCSIQEKFLMDAVVRAGKLPDDDFHHVVKTTYLFGEVDRARPRVEAEFIDMDE